MSLTCAPERFHAWSLFKLFSKISRFFRCFSLEFHRLDMWFRPAGTDRSGSSTGRTGPVTKFSTGSSPECNGVSPLLIRQFHRADSFHSLLWLTLPYFALHHYKQKTVEPIETSKTTPISSEPHLTSVIAYKQICLETSNRSKLVYTFEESVFLLSIIRKADLLFIATGMPRSFSPDVQSIVDTANHVAIFATLLHDGSFIVVIQRSRARL